MSALAEEDAETFGLEALSGGGNDGSFDLVVSYLPGVDVIVSLPLTSKALAAAAKEGRRNKDRGWDSMIRKALRALYERGEAKREGLDFLKTDYDGGREDIVQAARCGLRSAIAACLCSGYAYELGKEDTDNYETDMTDFGHDLWAAEHLAVRSGDSTCKWSAFYLAICYTEAVSHRAKRDHQP